MAKKHKHKKQKHRNSGGPPRPAAAPGPRRRNRRNVRGDKPDFGTAASAIAGGLGGAALGGWAARKGYDPRWVGALFAGAGGLAAYKFGGNARSASYGFAAAGAGQSMLEWLDKDEEQAKPNPKNDNKGRDKATQEAGAKQAKAEGNADPQLTYTANGVPRQSRRGGAGLDRAFNRTRERLQRIYEDDADDDRFDDEQDAA